MLGNKNFGWMSQEYGHLCVAHMDLFFILQMFIDHLSAWLSLSGKHILDILDCSVLHKLSGMDLFYVLCSENLLIPQFGQWFMSSCFPGSNLLDHEE